MLVQLRHRCGREWHCRIDAYTSGGNVYQQGATHSGGNSCLYLFVFYRTTCAVVSSSPAWVRSGLKSTADSYRYAFCAFSALYGRLRLHDSMFFANFCGLGNHLADVVTPAPVPVVAPTPTIETEAPAPGTLAPQASPAPTVAPTPSPEGRLSGLVPALGAQLGQAVDEDIAPPYRKGRRTQGSRRRSNTPLEGFPVL